MANPFFETTSVDHLGDGRFRGHIGPAWTLRPLPQGGVVTALALRAMAEVLGDPGQRLRTLHTAFVAQVAHGEVTIAVELLRRGRSMSHLRAEVTGPDSARGHVTTAAFGSAREGFSFTELSPPAEVPPPSACRSFRDPPPTAPPAEPVAFWTTIVESRMVRAHGYWEDHPPGPAESVTWCRFDDPPWQDDGTVDPLALVVLVDSMPGAVSERVGGQGRPWFAPSIDLTVHLLDECRSPWLLADNRARFAGDGYASAEMALWDCGADGTDRPRLVAYATQMFLFTFFD